MNRWWSFGCHRRDGMWLAQFLQCHIGSCDSFQGVRRAQQPICTACGLRGYMVGDTGSAVASPKRAVPLHRGRRCGGGARMPVGAPQGIQISRCCGSSPFRDHDAFSISYFLSPCFGLWSRSSRGCSTSPSKTLKFTLNLP